MEITMRLSDRWVSTGLKGLDDILNGLRLGDNVVWRVDTIDDYRAFAQRFVATALEESRRVVCGLGTRAVDRLEGDYPRLVALDQPLLPLHGKREDRRRFTQRDVDLLNLTDNALQTVPFSRLLAERLDIPVRLLAEPDPDADTGRTERGHADGKAWLLTCGGLLETTPG